MDPASPHSTIAAPTFTELLQEWVNVERTRHKHATLAALAKRAGFSSRSSITEILQGKKGLSAQSIARLAQALKLDRHQRELFRLLAYRDFPKTRPKNYSAEQLPLRIQAARDRLILMANKPSSAATRSGRPGVLGARSAYRVYAALGEVIEGATLQEIQSRSGYGEKELLCILDVLWEKGVVEKKEDRFIAVSDVLDAFGLAPDEALIKLFQEVGDQLKTQTTRLISNPLANLQYTAFSLNSEDRARFKRRLRQAVLRVIDEFQSDGGDAVAEVTVAAF